VSRESRTAALGKKKKRGDTQGYHVLIFCRKERGKRNKGGGKTKLGAKPNPIARARGKRGRSGNPVLFLVGGGEERALFYGERRSPEEKGERETVTL